MTWIDIVLLVAAWVGIGCAWWMRHTAVRTVRLNEELLRANRLLLQRAKADQS